MPELHPRIPRGQPHEPAAEGLSLTPSPHPHTHRHGGTRPGSPGSSHPSSRSRSRSSSEPGGCPGPSRRCSCPGSSGAGSCPARSRRPAATPRTAAALACRPASLSPRVLLGPAVPPGRELGCTAPRLDAGIKHVSFCSSAPAPGCAGGCEDATAQALTPTGVMQSRGKEGLATALLPSCSPQPGANEASSHAEVVAQPCDHHAAISLGSLSPPGPRAPAHTEQKWYWHPQALPPCLQKAHSGVQGFAWLGEAEQRCPGDLSQPSARPRRFGVQHPLHPAPRVPPVRLGPDQRHRQAPSVWRAGAGLPGKQPRREGSNSSPHVSQHHGAHPALTHSARAAPHSTACTPPQPLKPDRFYSNCECKTE